MIYIGTDEAGYGPLLGPLVIAATVFESDAPRAELVAEGAADSKVVYARRGRAGLARVLTPCFDVASPITLTALLEKHSVCGDPRSGYLWYGDVAEEDYSGQSSRAARPPEFCALYFNPVCEGEFNAACARDGSKGTVLFRETMRVVRAALDDLPPHQEVDVLCDKHGGRNSYGGLLMAELGPSNLVTESESRAQSSYRLTVNRRPMRVRFVAKADANDAPAALASMTAKYVRELFMAGLNEFFVSRREGLRPTAGYAVDGRRFLGDVRDLLEELQVDADRFVRTR